MKTAGRWRRTVPGIRSCWRGLRTAKAIQHAETVKARHPDIPWEQIYRFRNVAAHDYERIALERIWEVVRTHLPPLERAIAAEIKPIAQPRRVEPAKPRRAK